jgi:hypothetical protein
MATNDRVAPETRQRQAAIHRSFGLGCRDGRRDGQGRLNRISSATSAPAICITGSPLQTSLTGPRANIRLQLPDYKRSSLAVRVGFEPTVPAKVQRFSRPPDSTTLAPHRPRL